MPLARQEGPNDLPLSRAPRSLPRTVELDGGTEPPGRDTGKVKWLTVAEVCERLGISEHTWNKWRARRVGPPAKRLPNGQLRISERALNEWLENLDEGAA